MTSLSSLIAPYKKVPLNLGGGGLAEFMFPKGTGTYTIKEADFTHKHPSIALNNLTAGWVLGTDGYAYNISSIGLTGSAAGATGLPAKTTAVRLYEAWGRYESLTLVNFCGLGFEFNRYTGNDKWVGYMQWNAGVVDPYLAEYIAGAWNFRAAPSDITITGPLQWHMQLYDHGDTLVQVINALDNDTQNVNQSVSVKHYAASRNHKSDEAYYLWYTYDSSNPSYNKIRGFRISDI